MKELSIEEKAKRYDEALEIAKEINNEQQAQPFNVMTRVFPELKESEDEKVRKEIVTYLKSVIANKGYRDIIIESWIAWLEKQNTPTEDELEALRIAAYEPTKNWSEKLQSLYEKLIHYEQGEQKPADKVEPKFKVGDWITNSIETVQITGYDIDYGYQVDYKGKLQHRDTDIIEKEYHLWTIQDAKDGDVLTASDGSIFLFAGVVDLACKYYVALTTDGAFKFNEGLEHYWETAKGVKPSTKEQRDTLMKAMTDAGYEWDAENKQLRKIEPRQEELTEFEKAVKQVMEEAIECGDTHNLKADADMLLRLVQKSSWSEKDNKMSRFIGNAITVDDASIYLESKGIQVIDAHVWLNGLKDRVQPQKQEWKQENTGDLTDFENAMMCVGESFFGQYAGLDPNDINAIKGQANLLLELAPSKEWSKEDNRMCKAIIDNIQAICEEGYFVGNIDSGELIEWLKSLRPQSQWKPSDEQMDALEDAIADAVSSIQKNMLNSLYQDLKKLKQ